MIAMLWWHWLLVGFGSLLLILLGVASGLWIIGRVVREVIGKWLGM